MNFYLLPKCTCKVQMCSVSSAISDVIYIQSIIIREWVPGLYEKSNNVLTPDSNVKWFTHNMSKRKAVEQNPNAEFCEFLTGKLYLYMIKIIVELIWSCVASPIFKIFRNVRIKDMTHKQIYQWQNVTLPSPRNYLLVNCALIAQYACYFLWQLNCICILGYVESQMKLIRKIKT